MTLQGRTMILAQDLSAEYNLQLRRLTQLELSLF